jgi:hypothetical protein
MKNSIYDIKKYILSQLNINFLINQNNIFRLKYKNYHMIHEISLEFAI